MEPKHLPTAYVADQLRRAADSLEHLEASEIDNQLESDVHALRAIAERLDSVPYREMFWRWSEQKRAQDDHENWTVLVHDKMTALKGLTGIACETLFPFDEYRAELKEFLFWLTQVTSPGPEAVIECAERRLRLERRVLELYRLDTLLKNVLELWTQSLRVPVWAPRDFGHQTRASLVAMLRDPQSAQITSFPELVEQLEAERKALRRADELAQSH